MPLRRQLWIHAFIGVLCGFQIGLLLGRIFDQSDRGFGTLLQLAAVVALLGIAARQFIHALQQVPAGATANAT